MTKKFDPIVVDDYILSNLNHDDLMGFTKHLLQTLSNIGSKVSSLAEEVDISELSQSSDPSNGLVKDLMATYFGHSPTSAQRVVMGEIELSFQSSDHRKVQQSYVDDAIADIDDRLSVFKFNDNPEEATMLKLKEAQGNIEKLSVSLLNDVIKLARQNDFLSKLYESSCNVSTNILSHARVETSTLTQKISDLEKALSDERAKSHGLIESAQYESAVLQVESLKLQLQEALLKVEQLDNNVDVHIQYISELSGVNEKLSHEVIQSRRQLAASESRLEVLDMELRKIRNRENLIHAESESAAEKLEQAHNISNQHLTEIASLREQVRVLHAELHAARVAISSPALQRAAASIGSPVPGFGPESVTPPIRGLGMRSPLILPATPFPGTPPKRTLSLQSPGPDAHQRMKPNADPPSPTHSSTPPPRSKSSSSSATVGSDNGVFFAADTVEIPESGRRAQFSSLAALESSLSSFQTPQQPLSRSSSASHIPVLASRVRSASAESQKSPQSIHLSTEQLKNGIAKEKNIRPRRGRTVGISTRIPLRPRVDKNKERTKNDRSSSKSPPLKVAVASSPNISASLSGSGSFDPNKVPSPELASAVLRALNASRQRAHADSSTLSSSQQLEVSPDSQDSSHTPFGDTASPTAKSSMAGGSILSDTNLTLNMSASSRGSENGGAISEALVSITTAQRLSSLLSDARTQVKSQAATTEQVRLQLRRTYARAVLTAHNYLVRSRQRRALHQWLSRVREQQSQEQRLGAQDKLHALANRAFDRLENAKKREQAALFILRSLRRWRRARQLARAAAGARAGLQRAFLGRWRAQALQDSTDRAVEKAVSTVRAHAAHALSAAQAAVDNARAAAAGTDQDLGVVTRMLQEERQRGLETVSQLRKEISEVSKLLSEKQAENGSLLQELMESKALATRVIGELEGHAQTVELAQAQLELQTTQIETLKSSATAASVELEEVKIISQQRADALAERDAELARLQSEISRQQSELSTLHAQRTSLVTALETSKSDLSAARALHQDAAAHLAAAGETGERQGEQVSKLQRRVSELEKEVEIAEAAEVELRTRLERAERALEDALAAQRALAVRAAQADEAESRLLAAETSISAERSELEENRKKWKLEVDNVRTNVARAEVALQLQWNARRALERECERAVAASEAAQQVASAAEKEKNSALVDKATAEANLAVAEATAASLRVALEAAQSEIDRLQSTTAELSSTLTTMESEKDDITEHFKELETTFHALKNEFAAAGAEHSSSLSQLDENSRKAVEAAKKQEEKLVKERDNLSAKLKAADAETQRLQKDAREQKRLQQRLETDIAALDKKLKESDKNAVSLREKLEEAMAVAQRAVQAESAAERRAAQAEAEAISARVGLSAAQEKAADVEESLIMLQAKYDEYVDSATKKAAANAETIGGLRVSLSRAESDLEAFKITMKTRENEFAREIEVLRNSADSARVAEDAARATVAAAEQARLQALQSLQEAEDRTAVAVAESAALDVSAKASEVRAKEAEARADAARQRLVEVVGRLDDSSRLYAELEAALAAARSSADSANSALEQRETELSSIRAQLLEEERHRRAAELELLQLQQQLDTVLPELSTLRETVQKQRQQIEESIVAHEELAQHARELALLLEASRSREAAAAASYETLQSERRELLVERAGLHERNQGLQRELEAQRVDARAAAAAAQQQAAAHARFVERLLRTHARELQTVGKAAAAAAASSSRGFVQSAVQALSADPQDARSHAEAEKEFVEIEEMWARVEWLKPAELCMALAMRTRALCKALLAQLVVQNQKVTSLLEERSLIDKQLVDRLSSQRVPLPATPVRPLPSYPPASSQPAAVKPHSYVPQLSGSLFSNTNVAQGSVNRNVTDFPLQSSVDSSSLYSDVIGSRTPRALPGSAASEEGSGASVGVRSRASSMVSTSSTGSLIQSGNFLPGTNFPLLNVAMRVPSRTSMSEVLYSSTPIHVVGAAPTSTTLGPSRTLTAFELYSSFYSPSKDKELLLAEEDEEDDISDTEDSKPITNEKGFEESRNSEETQLRTPLHTIGNDSNISLNSNTTAEPFSDIVGIKEQKVDESLMPTSKFDIHFPGGENELDDSENETVSRFSESMSIGYDDALDCTANATESDAINDAAVKSDLVDFEVVSQTHTVSAPQNHSEPSLSVADVLAVISPAGSTHKGVETVEVVAQGIPGELHPHITSAQAVTVADLLAASGHAPIVSVDKSSNSLSEERNIVSEQLTAPSISSPPITVQQLKDSELEVEKSTKVPNIPKPVIQSPKPNRRLSIPGVPTSSTNVSVSPSTPPPSNATVAHPKRTLPPVLPPVQAVPVAPLNPSVPHRKPSPPSSTPTTSMGSTIATASISVPSAPPQPPPGARPPSVPSATLPVAPISLKSSQSTPPVLGAAGGIRSPPSSAPARPGPPPPPPQMNSSNQVGTQSTTVPTSPPSSRPIVRAPPPKRTPM